MYSLLFGSFCVAQAPVFHHLDIQDGLAQNTVLSITQDARGFMWFCTPDGLNRYDSRSFRTYVNDPTNQQSISSSWTTCSLSDAHHTLWIGTYRGLNKYMSQTDSFQQLLHNPANKNSLSDDRVLCLFEDRKGTKWVGTSNGLNRLTDPGTGRFDRYLYTDTGPVAYNQGVVSIYSICEDQQGNLWLATNKGLIRMSINKTITQYKTFRHRDDTPTSLSDNTVKAITCDRNNKLWVGTKKGTLDCYNPTDESFIHYLKMTSGESTYNEINCIKTDKNGGIWIGSLQGVIQLNPISMTFTRHQNDPKNPQSLSDNSIFSIFEDRQRSIWLGSYTAGLNILYPNTTPFKTVEPTKLVEGLSSNTVSFISEDQRHNLWIGSDGTGLDYLNIQAGLLAHYRAGANPGKQLPNKLIKTIFVDKAGYTWIGMSRGGLSRLDPTHRQWVSYQHTPVVAFSNSSDDVRAILEDSQQRFWVSFDQELDLFDRQKGTFRRYELATKPTRTVDSPISLGSSLVEDSHKNIWISGKEGVYLLKYKTSRFIWLPFAINTRPVDRPQWARCIHEDSQGRVWVGTPGGLKRFDPSRNTFIDYTEAAGLKTKDIAAIQSDAGSSLWLGTAYGLIRFNPKTKQSQHYTSADGIAGSEIMYNASYRDHKGNLYFGTNSGLVYFDPAAIQLNQHSPTVVFTSLEVANKVVNVGDKSHLLVRDISQTYQLTFNHRQNFFTINFALLNYIKPEKNQYAYKLEGLDQDWHSIKTPSITYTNLPPGDYTLLVKGANNDGIWSLTPSQLRLVLLPPWWKSWWAYGLYGLLVAISLYMLVRFFWLRDRLKREHELHQAKLDFFTNISHEIRTNLTLIAGPIDLLLSIEEDYSPKKKHLTYAKNNADRLLTLVTELMDFRRAESNELILQVSQNQLISFLENSMVSFQHLAEQKNVALDLVSYTNRVMVWFDPAQLEKVIYNLLSNAFKFIPDGGTIQLGVVEKGDWVAITVSDTGRGISATNVKKLFTNYFQGDTDGSQNRGYGIGLALSRRIAELHGGTLTVVSREARNGENGFTCFTLKLRKGYHHFTKKQLLDAAPPLAKTEIHPDPSFNLPEVFSETTKRYTILLIEDNDELRSFVKEVLTSQYHILEAINGQTGWEMALEHIPDLIISDIMMAELDGLTLCRRLKIDERTNHIPVILLTAKATINHQVEGLETGADSYITKPLSVPLLLLTIRNLFNACEIIRQKYSRHITLDPQNLVINSAQEAFIEKLIQIVEENMSVEGFVVEILATKVNMSVPVLYKKLKALTNMSVNDFIKSIRMKKAAQLLQQGDLNTNEVALAVGFDDRRYFSREFKKVFGVNPSEYAKGMPLP